MLIDFEKAFVNVHHSILYDLILVANFLNDKEILDMIHQEVADRTYNGKEFVLDEGIVVRSQTIKNMIKDDCVSNVIPLPNVYSKIMTKVIEYWKKHLEEGVHHSILHALILAANFLNDKEILDMMCQEVADRIKGKTPEEICKEFDNKSDFIPKEEEEICKENAWAFE
ncbi:hypothetical protein H5410_060797 [Solanum commersonii]|uniref:SKP1-like protein n=1 Tax=Solanum commersonii TaxID=4109 RepID=A0A9J5W6R3_SOLCO|nr:hypothetical protein H5410_060797 [Solanum commersonii]